MASHATLTAPHFRLPTFEGPLDLLLHLIHQVEVDIYDIPIAEITRQYLDHLATMQELDLAIAGEYLVMAATLVEIKSRMLLPQPPAAQGDEEAEDPRRELVERLLEYERYRATVETLRLWEERRNALYFRSALENPDDYLLPVQAGELTARALAEALQRVLAGTEVARAQISAIVPTRRVSLRMRMVEILRRVRSSGDGLLFDELVEPPWDLYLIVISFLAVLELLRTGRLAAEQSGSFAIRLRYVPEVAA